MKREILLSLLRELGI